MIELLTLLVAETLVPGFGVAIDLMKRGQRAMAGEYENIILLLQIPTASMDAPLSLSLSVDAIRGDRPLVGVDISAVVEEEQSSAVHASLD